MCIRDRAYTDLREKQEQLIQSEKLAAIGQLAAKVCHEINNPLTAISGCTQLMRRKLRTAADGLEDAEAFERYTETISRETERCSRITGELLQFARKSPPVFRAFDLHDVMSHTVSLLEYRSHSLHEVVCDFDFELPRILGDAQQITQVLLNVLMNAAEAMPEGGRIDIATRRSGYRIDGRDGVSIRIRDGGPGIPEDGPSRLFEAFYTTKQTGTGLGLTVCREILERHRGSLRIENAPEGGAVVTILLPFDPSASPADNARAVDPEQAATHGLPEADLARVLQETGLLAPDGQPDGQMDGQPDGRQNRHLAGHLLELGSERALG